MIIINFNNVLVTNCHEKDIMIIKYANIILILRIFWKLFSKDYLNILFLFDGCLYLYNFKNVV